MPFPRVFTPRVRVLVVLGILMLAAPAAPALDTPRAVASTPPTFAGCPTLPADNVWNSRVDQLPVHPRSNDYLTSIGLSTGLKADFGSGLWNGGPIGIPYVTVPGTQPRVPVTFDYADESDPGPYPIPPNPPIEGGPGSTGDRHVIMVDRDACVLYELYSAYPNPDGSWHAGSGAIFPMTSNALRPATWTSADAAGLPILPGLARYDEIAAGEISHALRFTASVTQRAYLWPARHYASSNTSPSVPPMGIRVRLKASYDISGFSPTNQIILRALKTYGMILADNGSNWFISGEPDSRWNNTELQALRSVVGSAFEVVDESSLMMDANSGQARPFGPAGTSTPTPTRTPTPSQTSTRTATLPATTTNVATVTRAATVTQPASATPTATSVATKGTGATPTQPATATFTATAIPTRTATSVPSATATSAPPTSTVPPPATPRKGKKH